MPPTPLRQVLHALASPEREKPDAELVELVARGADPAAFEALVRRHGPLVLATARRVLGCEADAEDVFQATFILLARKAATLRNGALVGCWLRQAARLIAAKLRSQRARRAVVERAAAVRTETGSTTGSTTGAAERADLGRVLDEELDRLPKKYRDPLVLCYLQGLTSEQAATHLGWPVGTLWGRMARGRDMLRRRLERRGVALSAGPATGVLLLAAGSGAAVPPRVVAEAVRLLTTGAGCPARSLAVAAARGATIARLAVILTGVVLAGAVAWASGVAIREQPATDNTAATAAQPEAARPPVPLDAIVLRQDGPDLLATYATEVPDAPHVVWTGTATGSEAKGEGGASRLKWVELSFDVIQCRDDPGLSARPGARKVVEITWKIPNHTRGEELYKVVRQFRPTVADLEALRNDLTRLERATRERQAAAVAAPAPQMGSAADPPWYLEALEKRGK